MEAWILDENFNSIAILDHFESFIWADRYNEVGDFEIYMPTEVAFFSELLINRYLWFKESEKLMIIEDLTIDTDPEAGDHLTVTGRSLESILERRIIWNLTTLDGNLQNGIKRLLEENVILPSIRNRTIPNFTFRASTDSRITSLKYANQFRGENLLEVITGICQGENLGWRILPDWDNAPGFIFELYLGQDRSFEQTANLPVVFSNKYENLLATNYYESERDYKTDALVVATNNEVERKAEVSRTSPGVFGLKRREIFVSGQLEVEIPEPPPNEPEDTDDDGRIGRLEQREWQTKWDEYNATIEANENGYSSQLIDQGKDALAETAITISFNGEADVHVQFVYGKDFWMGDIVQVLNEYQKEARCRITELVMTHDATGETIVPTFTNVEDLD